MSRRRGTGGHRTRKRTIDGKDGGVGYYLGGEPFIRHRRLMGSILAFRAYRGSGKKERENGKLQAEVCVCLTNRP